MTATYDRRLILPAKGRGVLPCCADMHDALFLDVMYRGVLDRAPCVALRLEDKRGRAIKQCPWCGAVPEVTE